MLVVALFSASFLGFEGSLILTADDPHVATEVTVAYRPKKDLFRWPRVRDAWTETRKGEAGLPRTATVRGRTDSSRGREP